LAAAGVQRRQNPLLRKRLARRDEKQARENDQRDADAAKRDSSFTRYCACRIRSH
jgi:hypothetical protein